MKSANKYKLIGAVSLILIGIFFFDSQTLVHRNLQVGGSKISARVYEGVDGGVYASVHGASGFTYHGFSSSMRVAETIAADAVRDIGPSNGLVLFTIGELRVFYEVASDSWRTDRDPTESRA